MKNGSLVLVMEAVSAQDLKELAAIKGKLVELEKRKTALEKEHGAVVAQIDALRKSVAKTWARRTRGVLKPGAVGKRQAGRKRIAQPSLSSLIVEILKESKKPVGINQISEALLNAKKYKTHSKNFKGQLRVLLYKNEKKLFKKAGPGLFTVA
jgi:hypothetical protein